MPKILINKEKREAIEIDLTDWPDDCIRTVDLIKIFKVSRQRINKAMIEVGSTSPHEKLFTYLMADQIFGSMDEEESESELWLKDQMRAIG